MLRHVGHTSITCYIVREIAAGEAPMIVWVGGLEGQGGLLSTLGQMPGYKGSSVPTHVPLLLYRLRDMWQDIL